MLLDGESYRNYICSLKSSFTRDAYAKALLQFMKFRRILSSNDLIKEDPRFLQSNIIDRLIHVKEVKKLSSARGKCYCRYNQQCQMSCIVDKIIQNLTVLQEAITSDGVIDIFQNLSIT